MALPKDGMFDEWRNLARDTRFFNIPAGQLDAEDRLAIIGYLIKMCESTARDVEHYDKMADMFQTLTGQENAQWDQCVKHARASLDVDNCSGSPYSGTHGFDVSQCKCRFYENGNMCAYCMSIANKIRRSSFG